MPFDGHAPCILERSIDDQGFYCLPILNGQWFIVGIAFQRGNQRIQFGGPFRGTPFACDFDFEERRVVRFPCKDLLAVG